MRFAVLQFTLKTGYTMSKFAGEMVQFEADIVGRIFGSIK